MDGIVQQIQDALGAQYRVDCVVARGGMSTVLRAFDRKHDRVVAVKVLHPELAGSMGADRFLREIRLIASLQHPHILPLFDSGSAAGVLYYIMPFIDGETLRDRLVRCGQLAIGESLQLAREMCDALAYAHERDIVHRDIKPENVLLSGGHALLLDFGIARAIHIATKGGTTGSGMVVGTPAYMSPEQASGEQFIDGRSDIYSLGCVLYEMLAGVPPHHGASARAIIAERLSSDPRPLRELRPDVPPLVEQVLASALTRDPAERFATAREFGSALLEGESSASSMPASSSHPTPARRWKALALGALLFAGIAVTARTFWPTKAPALDDTTIAVLPLLHSEVATQTSVSGDHCARLLYDALARWSGVKLVDAMRVRDARSRSGAAPATLQDALDVARELGAGRAVWGEIIETAGEVEVRATLYDVGGEGRVLQSAIGRRSNREVLAPMFEQIADSLISGSVIASRPPPAGFGTRSVVALRAYVLAQDALDDWNLVAAESLFQKAVHADTGFALAYLELAQAQMLARTPFDSTWRLAASRAVSMSMRLPESRRPLAEALLALAGGATQTACALFEEMLKRDSLSFAAWFGMGECRARDRAVLADARSRSGWRFRSSQQQAIDAYRRAFELVPTFQKALTGTTFDRLERLLYTEANHVRLGMAVGRDTMRFVAFPEIAGETLAFVPVSREAMSELRPEAYPATRQAALERNRRVMRDLSTNWVRASPRDPYAYEALAMALESLGEIDAPGPSADLPAGAMDAITRARALAVAPIRLRLAARHLRLLVKAGRYAAAAALADSLLQMPSATSNDALLLAGAAALTGRTVTAARWARPAAPPLYVDAFTKRERALATVARESFALLAYAAAGGTTDSVQALMARIEASFDASVPSSARASLQDLVEWPATLAYPFVGSTRFHRPDAGGNVHMIAQVALTRGDTVTARAELARLDEQGAHDRPGDAGFDAIALEVELRTALGDTAGAVALADRTLSAVPSSGRQLVELLAESSAFGRLVADRAILASRTNDTATAHTWARAYVALMSKSEYAARSRLPMMHSILESR